MPTPGRSRTGLSICGDSGAVAVVSIGRSGTVICLYDMMLREKGRKTASEILLNGNELLSAVCLCMNEFREEGMRNGNFCDLMPAAEAFGEDGTGKTLLCRFAGTVNFLCTIFPISVVFVQGGENLCRGWKKAADEFLENTLKCRYRLRFEEISGLNPDARSSLAEIVRTKALLA